MYTHKLKFKVGDVVHIVDDMYESTGVGGHGLPFDSVHIIKEIDECTSLNPNPYELQEYHLDSGFWVTETEIELVETNKSYKEKNTMSDKTIMKLCGAGLLCLFLIFLALNSYTTVQSGSVKVGKLFGKVDKEVLTEGFHVVNPMKSFTMYNTKECTTDIQVSIPAQDKFSSTADLSIRWVFDGGYAPTTLTTLGGMNVLESKIIQKPLVSLIKEAGRSVKVSQDLFLESTQKLVQNHIRNGLERETADYGITIKAVYLGNIQLDEGIMIAIKKTKRMQEEREQQAAKLERQALEYQKDVKQAEATATAAESKKMAAKHKADAELYKAKTIADAKFYNSKREAEANTLIAKSITPPLLQLRQLDVDMQRAKSWNGGVPTTLMGESSGVVPLYHMNNK